MCIVTSEESNEDLFHIFFVWNIHPPTCLREDFLSFRDRPKYLLFFFFSFSSFFSFPFIGCNLSPPLHLIVLNFPLALAPFHLKV